jgi:hypothetical protein
MIELFIAHRACGSMSDTDLAATFGYVTTQLRLRISTRKVLSLAPELKNIPAHFVIEMLTVPRFSF